jgi:pyruvate formate lyase activating enzyme
MNGYVHSIESFGSVDGPGIRFILFLQGCALRCGYCHNPDSWNMSEGQSREVAEIVEEVLKYKEFFDASGGGVTVSGGEPLLQMPFVTALFKELKKHGIHTNIDTSGDLRLSSEKRKEQLRELLSVTDMMMLDIKLMDSEGHEKLTGKTNEHILELGRFVAETGTPMWIRRVLVPGVTDADEDLEKTADYIRSLGVVEKVEVLPYHSMGEYKWEEMGYEYPLKGVEKPSAELVDHAEDILNSAFK